MHTETAVLPRPGVEPATKGGHPFAHADEAQPSARWPQTGTITGAGADSIIVYLNRKSV